MVEGARLESVYTRKGIAGSNPALSAERTNIEVPREGHFCFHERRELARGSEWKQKWKVRSAALQCFHFMTAYPRDHENNPALSAFAGRSPKGAGWLFIFRQYFISGWLLSSGRARIKQQETAQAAH